MPEHEVHSICCPVCGTREPICEHGSRYASGPLKGSRIVRDGRCKTCRWWDGPGEVGKTNPFGAARCNHEKVSDEGKDLFPDGASDAEGYGGINTGPDFGCIHHEPKDSHA